jgi:Uma2 family endonuclease
MAVLIERKRFTVEEYYRMAETGILSEDDRVELIEIYAMSPIGKNHAGCVLRTSTLLHRRVGEDVLVSVQNPIALDDFSEPQPDIVLLRFRDDYYAKSHPVPGDILLIIEVADTSPGMDRDLKLPAYARAGIEEVWIVDLQSDLIRVYSRPEEGEYQHYREARRGESLAPVPLPSLSVPAEAILGGV